MTWAADDSGEDKFTVGSSHYHESANIRAESARPGCPTLFGNHLQRFLGDPKDLRIPPEESWTDPEELRTSPETFQRATEDLQTSP